MRSGSRLGAAALLAGLSAGCGVFQRRAPVPPPVVIVQGPIILQEELSASAAPMAPPADLTPLAPAMAPTVPPLPAPDPPTVAARRPTEAAPRPAEHGNPPEADQGNDSEGLRLSTALSPAQQAASRRNTEAVLRRTQGAMQTLQRRHNLNKEAQATLAQVGEYVREAQTALGQGDLVRAQTLAGKAETLARFLLGG